MKKIISFSIIIIALLIVIFVAFNSNGSIDRNELGTSLPFVANEGEISLLIVGDSNISTDYVKEKLNISKLHKITRYDSLKEFQESHSGLSLEKSPAYVLFDSKEPIYQTYEFENLVSYTSKMK